ncbi:hypothetical protein ALP36_04298 [Pseudomonas syringae pv. coriandricola]|uniref:AbiJ N-terminal domain-containing protein n=1 Tax=Pseudomonas syringae pv. coriandricola TaxID=264453 RepID=A0A3M4UBG2_9PSED|nr:MULTISPECIES: hypothetical protein [Pseudomonas syringae group]RMR36780.1 hypothetical protein ALP87_03336 [Pseudomonas syringae pv. coriandricola]RMU02082.1 hypothetical protein ALP36_04298 [Pseudomonas syringae pv. coriandricola]
MNKYDSSLILELKRRIEEDFTSGNWEEAGLLTDSSHIISGHPRLLRSLNFGDQDYGGNIIHVLRSMSDHNPDALRVLKEYLDKWYPDQNVTYISAKPSERKISFAPNVFSIPDGNVEDDLVAVMMPFSGFDAVYQSIRNACDAAAFRCLRADDIWDNSSIIQDIFSLIYRAKIVIVDFSGKNPNVMYETGIAHTLGKTVVPLAQVVQDIPSDMVHHRALIYLKNGEGLQKLERELIQKLGMIRGS